MRFDKQEAGLKWPTFDFNPDFQKRWRAKREAIEASFTGDTATLKEALKKARARRPR